MKEALIKKGKVCRIYPYTKTLPDGTVIVKELPPPYRGGTRSDGVVKGRHPLIQDVPDEVQPGWRWDGEKFAPPPPKPPLVEPRSSMIEVFAKHLGVGYEELLEEIRTHKRARRNAANKAD